MKQEETQQNMQKPKESKLSSSVFERIDKEQVTPVPKWQFLITEYGIWVLWALSVVFGAIAVSVMIFVSMHAGFAFYEATHETPLSFFVEVLPYVWILLFLGMAGLAYFNVRKTKKGYRYPVWHILFSSLFVSVCVGFVLHYAGVGHMIDTQLSKKMPLFPSLERIEAHMWQAPEEGRLIGSLVSKRQTESNDVIFKDVDGVTWVFNTEELMPPDLQVLFSGNKVRVLGVSSTSSDGYFHGCGVFPWMYDKATNLDDMRSERKAFVERMYGHKDRAKERFDALQREFYASTTLEDMMGVCAKQAVVKRIELQMVR